MQRQRGCDAILGVALMLGQGCPSHCSVGVPADDEVGATPFLASCWCLDKTFPATVARTFLSVH